MDSRSLFLLLALCLFSTAAFGQSSWLDRPLNNWNRPNAALPQPPRFLTDPNLTQCREQIREPESIADRAVTRVGWSLFGPSQNYGPVTIVNALASFDGMCRPTQFNTFVFIGNRFGGTLAPDLMDSRTDGSLVSAHLTGPTAIVAEFNRYSSADPLCCPSQTSAVTYTVTTGPRGVVAPTDVNTAASCRTGTEDPVDRNTVRGTVTYRQRIALPQTAVLTVKLLDVSRQDTSSTAIAEQRIETLGKQVPIPFEVRFDESLIRPRGRYAVRAEISNNDRLLYITDVAVPVLNESGRDVEIVVVPVRGGGQGGDQRGASITGTVAYPQGAEIPAGATVTVRLVDLSLSGATNPPIAEDTFAAGARRNPIPFELRFQRREIDQQRNYGLEAEIRSSDRVLFRTREPVGVLTTGNPVNDVRLELISDTPVITGQTLSVSKFGTGTLRIDGRSDDLIVRGSLSVRPDGTAEVSIFRISGEIRFSGQVTQFDDRSVTISVSRSGDADAGGQIVVQYSGRRLNSISSNGLILDGQGASIVF